MRATASASCGPAWISKRAETVPRFGLGFQPLYFDKILRPGGRLFICDEISPANDRNDIPSRFAKILLL